MANERPGKFWKNGEQKTTLEKSGRPALLAYHSESPGYERIVAEVTERLKRNYAEVVLLDMDAAKLQKVALRSKSNYRVAFQRECSISESQMQKLSRRIGLAVNSEMAWLFRKVKIRPTDFVIRVSRNRSTRLAFQIFEKALFAIRELRPAIVALPNGRYPLQAAVSMAALFENVQMLHWEKDWTSLKGDKDSKFYLQRCSPQDRTALQEIIVNESKSLNTIEICRVARKWANAQQSASNPFFRVSRNAAPAARNAVSDRSGSTLTVFFTSSPDELVGLENWSTRGWDSQCEGFQDWASRHVGPGESLVIRMHPNCLEMGTLDFLNEIWSIIKFSRKQKELRVVTSGQQINSYDLLRRASDVVVARSTLGVEATWMGIRTWCVWETSYDLVVDVVRWGTSGSESIPRNGWSPDPLSAARYIAGHALLFTAFQFAEEVAASGVWKARPETAPPARISVGTRTVRVVIAMLQSITNVQRQASLRKSVRVRINKKLDSALGVLLILMRRRFDFDDSAL